MIRVTVLFVFCCFVAIITRSAPFPPGTAASGGVRNMALVYLDERSVLKIPTYLFPPSKYEKIISYGNASAPFFDSILLIGYSWKDEKCFWPGQCKVPMNATDWSEIGSLWRSMGLQNINSAAQETNQTIKVFVTIIYPDTRQRNFGSFCGKETYDFAITADRLLAVQCWIDTVVTMVHESSWNNIELVGFYWYLENIVPEDLVLLPNVAQYIHEEKKLKLCWIPDYDSSNQVPNWVSYGFDFVTLQPNYAFQNATVDRFEKVNDIISASVAGVEMELPLAVRNYLIDRNATTSFENYLSAAVKYNWVHAAIKTFYLANDFATMALSNNKTQLIMYDQLYRLVSGKL